MRYLEGIRDEMRIHDQQIKKIEEANENIYERGNKSEIKEYIYQIKLHRYEAIMLLNEELINIHKKYNKYIMEEFKNELPIEEEPEIDMENIREVYDNYTNWYNNEKKQIIKYREYATKKQTKKGLHIIMELLSMKYNQIEKTLSV